MSRFLYQTFYLNNKFDNPVEIDSLEKWMFSKKNKEQLFKVFLENSINDTTITDSNIENTLDTSLFQKTGSNKDKFYIPNQLDTLFWSIFISHYGEPYYLSILHKYGNAEIVEKQKIMDYLKSNRGILKKTNHKLSLGSTQEIMSELMTNTKTSLLAINAFMMYYKVNIIIQNTFNNTYINYSYDLSDDTKYNSDVKTNTIIIKYIEENGKKKYAYLQDNQLYLKDYTKGICIERPDKPLRGISTYKLNDLIDIATIYNSYTNTNIILTSTKSEQKKRELYEKLWHLLLWV